MYWEKTTAARNASPSATAAHTWCPRSISSAASPSRSTAESSAITTRMAPTLSRVQRQFDGDHRRAALRAGDRQAAVHRADPLREAVQAAAGADAGAAGTVVADAEAEHPLALRRLEPGPPRAAGPDPVGRKLGAAEEGVGSVGRVGRVGTSTDSSTGTALRAARVA